MKRALCRWEGGTKMTVMDAIALHQYKRIYISLGVNELGWVSTDIFIEDYGKIIDTLKETQPDATIYVQAILPVSAAYEKAKPSMANEKINRYNEKLREITESCGGRFLDTSAVLKDETGALASEYDSGDGLHYNKTAYKVLFQYIEEHLDEAM